MFHQIQQAIDAQISLSVTLKDWDEIANELAERRRKRTPQLAIPLS